MGKSQPKKQKQNWYSWKTATGKSVEQNLFSMSAKKEEYLCWIQLSFGFLPFSKALVSSIALPIVSFLTDSQDMKAYAGHGQRKAELALAQQHDETETPSSSSGIVIWSSVQKDILAREFYKRRDSKKDITTTLCQQCSWTRLGPRLPEWLGIFPLCKLVGSVFTP